MANLDTVPPEILEHIAYLLATDNLLGPPSALIPFLGTNREVYSRLSVFSNHHLYARIFAAKFDLVPAIRRLGLERTSPEILTRELQRRCTYLKRMRARLDSTVDPSRKEDTPEGNPLHELLFHAYLLMLENEGRNEQQLRDYAKIDDWLKEYWFHECGASRAKQLISADQWPPHNEETSLAMWLFWFLLKPGGS